MRVPSSDLLTPGSASPLRGNLMGSMGRRVRTWGLPDDQKRVLLMEGSGYTVALGMSRCKSAGVVRGRDAALSSDPVNRRRVSRSPVRWGLRVVLFVL